PSFAQAIACADGRGVPLEAIDPSDDRYAEMFAEHIGYTELLRRTLRERRLSRRPPEVRTADEFSLAWALATSASGGSGRLARAREEAVVAKARSLGARYPRVALVVDRERFPTLLAAFGPPAPA
ncbi:MAG TPA: hypothetical protein VGS18_01180, partial [Thermoplasmata archaeon]|nr:hypothetical protein [Thermoplasmata archaeon]